MILIIKGKLENLINSNVNAVSAASRCQPGLGR